MGYNLLVNGIYWSYNPLANHLPTSWDIQVVANYFLLVTGMILQAKFLHTSRCAVSQDPEHRRLWSASRRLGAAGRYCYSQEEQGALVMWGNGIHGCLGYRRDEILPSYLIYLG